MLNTRLMTLIMMWFIQSSYHGRSHERGPWGERVTFSDLDHLCDFRKIVERFFEEGHGWILNFVFTGGGRFNSNQ